MSYIARQRKKKECKFQNYIDSALLNIDEWNKKVKREKYTINKYDTDEAKVLKIYRWANEYEE